MVALGSTHVQLKDLLFSGPVFDLLIADQANSSRVEVAIFRYGDILAATLLAEASTAVAAVLDPHSAKAATKLCLTLVAVEGKMGWHPDGRSTRLIFGG